MGGYFSQYEAERGHVERTLAAHKFENPDIGPINRALEMDCFVFSIPKCATTALQRGLARTGLTVLHAHNNPTTYRAFANGRVLEAEGLTLQAIIRARLAACDKPLDIFFGYREPIGWLLSLAAHFGLTEGLPVENIRAALESEHPWCDYRIDETAKVIEEAIGVDILSHAFNREIGVSLIRKNNVRLHLYRFDAIDRLAVQICREVTSDFHLTPERVNASFDYCSMKALAKIGITELKKAIADPWFEYFCSMATELAMIRDYVAVPAVKDLQTSKEQWHA